MESPKDHKPDTSHEASFSGKSKIMLHVLCVCGGVVLLCGGFLAGIFFFTGVSEGKILDSTSNAEQTTTTLPTANTTTDTSTSIQTETTASYQTSSTTTVSTSAETTTASSTESVITSTEAASIQTTAALALQDVTFYDESFTMLVWTDDNSSVNMRREPSLNGERVLLIPHGTEVSVLGICNGWCLVRYGGNTGFVRRDMLIFGEAGEAWISGAWPMTVSTSTGQSVNLRSQPSVNSQSLALVPNGTQVSCWSHENGWVAVEYNGQYGFIREDLLMGQ